MFSNAKQHIPQPFLDKIEIDKRIKNFMNRDVIPLSEHDDLQKLVDERGHLRYTCKKMLKRDSPANGLA